jgi:hypothetical protein
MQQQRSHNMNKQQVTHTRPKTDGSTQQAARQCPQHFIRSNDQKKMEFILNRHGGVMHIQKQLQLHTAPTLDICQVGWPHEGCV